MDTIKIYGASDDNVEVEGTVPGCGEYDCYDHPLWVQLSTGDVFKVEYIDQGVWKVDHIAKSRKKVQVVKEPHGEGEDPEPYTETVTVTGVKIDWVETWKEWPITEDAIGDKVAKFFDLGDHEELPDLTGSEIMKIWEVVRVARLRK